MNEKYEFYQKIFYNFIFSISSLVLFSTIVIITFFPSNCVNNLIYHQIVAVDRYAKHKKNVCNYNKHKTIS